MLAELEPEMLEYRNDRKITSTANNRFAKLRGEVLALSFAFFYLIWCGLTEVLQVQPQILKPANR